MLPITPEDIDKIYEWIDSPDTPICGYDGWYPSYEDLKFTLIPAFDNVSKFPSKKNQRIAKQIMAFIYWLGEAPKGCLEPETIELINQFIAEHGA